MDIFFYKSKEISFILPTLSVGKSLERFSFQHIRQQPLSYKASFFAILERIGAKDYGKLAKTLRQFGKEDRPNNIFYTFNGRTASYL